MPAYFVKYLSMIFKNNKNHFIVSFFIYLVFLYLFSAHSTYTYLFGLGSILYLCVMWRDANKSYIKGMQDYRQIESLLLPLSDKEYILSEYLRLFLNFFPSTVVVFMVVIGLEGSYHAREFWVYLVFSFIGMLFFNAITTYSYLRINFKKQTFVHSLTRFTRSFLFFMLPIGVFFFFIKQRDANAHLIAIAFYSTLAIFIILSLLLFNAQEQFFNEHIVYKNKKIKLIDIPGLLVIAGAVSLVVFIFITEPKARKPASINPQSLGK